MARNRTSPIEDVITIASKLPWWVPKEVGGVIQRNKRKQRFNQTEAAAKNRRCSAKPLCAIITGVIQ
jgi:hypothetical protein